jgi:small-conductance mechanosensitive channel
LLTHVLVVFLTCGSALAQKPADAARFKQQTEAWVAVFGNIREEVLTTSVTRPRLFRLQTVVADTVQDIEAARNAALVRSKTVEFLLAKLGTAPKAGQPAESEEVAQERRILTQRRSRIQGRIKLTDLLLARSRELRNLINKRQRQRLATQLGTRGPAPLTLSTWRKALPDLANVYGTVARSPLVWWNSKPMADLRARRSIPIILLLVISAAVFMGWFLRAWLLRRYGRNRKIKDPSYARRVVAAIAEGAANGVVPAPDRSPRGRYRYRGLPGQAATDFCLIFAP